MINKPPLSELEKKVSCRYMLVSVIAKRARQLVGQGDTLNDRKAVSIAVEELNEGKIDIAYPDENAK